MPLWKSRSQEADKLVTGSSNDKDNIFIVPNCSACRSGWLTVSRVLRPGTDSGYSLEKR